MGGPPPSLPLPSECCPTAASASRSVGLVSRPSVCHSGFSQGAGADRQKGEKIHTVQVGRQNEKEVSDTNATMNYRT